MRIALYTRVSTTDKGQTVENQFMSLRADCKHRKEQIVIEEQDYISGTKERRPGLDRIFAAAANHEFDVLAVWSLDRLTREGALRTLQIIQDLGKLGITFRSLQEPYFDTGGPFKDVIVSMAACLAKLEREKIVERVKAGLERTRAAGTILGPPRIERLVTSRILELAAKGYKPCRIAAETKYLTRGGDGREVKAKHPSERMVRRVLRKHQNGVVNGL